MNNSTFEILSDAGEVLASSPLPDEALIEAREGEVKEFSLVAEVERDGHAATFRGRDAGGRTYKVKGNLPVTWTLTARRLGGELPASQALREDGSVKVSPLAAGQGELQACLIAQPAVCDAIQVKVY